MSISILSRVSLCCWLLLAITHRSNLVMRDNTRLVSREQWNCLKGEKKGKIMLQTHNDTY